MVLTERQSTVVSRIRWNFGLGLDDYVREIKMPLDFDHDSIGSRCSFGSCPLLSSDVSRSGRLCDLIRQR